VENYPGFVKGIPGPDLVKLFKGQAERLGVTILMEEVHSAHYEGDNFRIVTNLREIHAQILVAATGTTPKQLPDTLAGNEVQNLIHYEVYPLRNEKDKEFVIIGAGDAAFDYALNLSKRNKITILNRSSKVKALTLLVERVQKKSGIGYHSETPVSGIYLNDVEKVVVAAETKGLAFECDLVLAAIGREPDYGFAGKSIIERMENLLKDRDLFLIGDLQNGTFRQTTIAVADGIRSALLIAQILEKG